MGILSPRTKTGDLRPLGTPAEVQRAQLLEALLVEQRETNRLLREVLDQRHRD